MSLLDTVANIATSALDQYGDMLFGGQLQKAKLMAVKSPTEPEVLSSKDFGEIEFFLNPETVRITKEAEFDQEQVAQNLTEVTWKNTKPTQMDIGELWFDTYETRENVREKYISKLEKHLDFVDETHHIPCLMLVWGKFLTETENFLFYLSKLDVTYTMFLPDGTPVRAKVALSLKGATTMMQKLQEIPKQSPDHAKLHTVRRGDTLQGIAMKEYDDPGQWRRIADLNGIDNPMNLAPGRKLLVPPILK